MSGCRFKKILFLVIGLVIVLITGCQSNINEKTLEGRETDSGLLTEEESNSTETEPLKEAKDGVLEIEEDKFVSQMEEIYNYSDKYLGETVRYQGYIFLEKYEGKDYLYVVRNTYVCECAEEESVVGFEIAWEGDIPEEGTWVEVTGVLDSYVEEENEYILVRVSNLDVKDEIGKTFVTE
ncbi:MAG TPA: hypothetical protein DIC60_04300 [Lachnospiraceae bacterium]|nr:hypothetical protein [Lachnospiraceae bacterium]